jgi:hypothetical protein
LVCSDAIDGHSAERIADTETTPISLEGAAKPSCNGRFTSSIARSGFRTEGANDGSQGTPANCRVSDLTAASLAITEAGRGARDGILVAPGAAATRTVPRGNVRLGIVFIGVSSDMSVGPSTKITLGSTHLDAVKVAISVTTLARHVTRASRG